MIHQLFSSWFTWFSWFWLMWLMAHGTVAACALCYLNFFHWYCLYTFTAMCWGFTTIVFHYRCGSLLKMQETNLMCLNVESGSDFFYINMDDLAASKCPHSWIKASNEDGSTSGCHSWVGGEFSPFYIETGFKSVHGKAVGYQMGFPDAYAVSN